MAIAMGMGVDMAARMRTMSMLNPVRIGIGITKSRRRSGLAIILDIALGS